MSSPTLERGRARWGGGLSWRGILGFSDYTPLSRSCLRRSHGIRWRDECGHGESEILQRFQDRGRERDDGEGTGSRLDHLEIAELDVARRMEQEPEAGDRHELPEHIGSQEVAQVGEVDALGLVEDGGCDTEDEVGRDERDNRNRLGIVAELLEQLEHLQPPWLASRTGF